MNRLTLSHHRNPGSGLSSLERAYASANLAGWMATANCRNLGWLWNAAEDHDAWNGGDVNAQHAAHAALELCTDCPALAQCRTWATYDRYSGLAGGLHWARGRPTGQTAPKPPAIAPLHLYNTRLLNAPVHTASRPVDSQPTIGQVEPSHDREDDQVIAAYFLIPLTTPLPLDTETSYAFIEDISHVEYVTAGRAEPDKEVDVDALWRAARRREASLRLHPIPADAKDWTTTVSVALPWLAPAAIEALPRINSEVQCLIEACVTIDSLWPSEDELHAALDYATDCIMRLHRLAARTQRRHLARYTRASLPQWIGLALTKLDANRRPITGHYWLINSRTYERSRSPRTVAGGQPNKTRSRESLPPPSAGSPKGPSRRLVAAINATDLPDLLWSQANATIAALRTDMAEWVASEPLSVEGVLRDDRLGVDLVVQAPRGIPTHRWSLEACHALDDLCAAMRTAAGVRHISDREVAASLLGPAAVPKSTTRQRPDETARADTTGPHDGASGNVVAPPACETAALLADLRDLLHRAIAGDIITASIEPRPTQSRGFLEYDTKLVQILPRIAMHSGGSLRDGAVVGTVNTGLPVRLIGHIVAQLRAKIGIAHGGALCAAVPLLEQLLTETRRCLDRLV